VTEPTATFSTCFGAPFMPRHPSVYGELLRERLEDTGATCWLVNTGWTGGAHGVGHRMPISVTRALLNAALDGSLNDATYREDEHFGFLVPTAASGVETGILDPRSTWEDKDAFDAQATRLAGMFRENFAKFEAHVADDVIAAAPGA
ncbi:MAG: phosphoenolpyruvate carboxykinase (ATP), partial [Pseudomonadota bacterium]